MRLEDNSITFELTDDEKRQLEFAFGVLRLNTNEKDPGNYFYRNYIERVFADALKSLRGRDDDRREDRDSSDYRSHYKYDEKEELHNTTVRRITKWANSQQGTAYFLIKTYFDVLRTDDGFVSRDMMMDHYVRMAVNNKGRKPEDAERRFYAYFRQMSSSSPTAYGKIFAYDNSDGERRVTLDPEYKDHILSLRDKF